MIKIRKTAALALALGLAAAPFSALPALAQTAPAAPETAVPLPAPTEAAPVDEQKLQSFVVAFLEVNKVGQEYQPRLQAAAADQAEQAKIQEEASQKMVEAVEGTNGITVEEYSTILSSAQTDPQLAGQINEMIRQSAPEGAAGTAPAQPAEPNMSPAQ